jgi:large subunit ribosomal protein L2
MPVIKMKPTSPGTRFVVKLDKSHLWKGGPHEPLVVSKTRHSGRNNVGRITTRHQGSGTYHKYRLIDFKRDKDGIKGVVERLEHDPNRTSHIALIKYSDGERRYILAAKGMKPGDEIRSGADSPIKSGNAMQLRHIPVGSIVHNVELKPGKGGQMARSAGSGIQLVAKDDGFAVLRLPSGEMRRVPLSCRATVGQVGNVDHENISSGKAGRSRWLGKRPTVRGSAMNPVDHPHGGGEGKSKGGRHPVTPWGVPTLGKRTRRKHKESDKLIVRGRRRGKERR